MAFLPPLASIGLLGAVGLGVLALAGRIRSPLAAIATVATGLAMGVVTLNGLRLGEHLTVADALLLVGAVGIPFAIARGPFPTWLLVSALLLVASVALASVGAADPVASLTAGLLFLAALFLVPLIIGTAGHPELMADLWGLSVLVGGASAVANITVAPGLTTALTGIDVWGQQPGLSTHFNALGLGAAMVLPVALSRVLSAPLARRPVLLVILGGALTALLLSGSRAAILGAVVGIGTLLVFGRVRRGPLVLSLLGLTIAGVALVLIGGPSFSVVIDRLTGTIDIGASDEIRVQLYQASLAAFFDSPLIGNGYADIRLAHDIYLQILEAGGLLGLAAFVTFVVGAIRLGRRLPSPLGAGLVASLLSWLAIGTVQNAIYDRYLYVPVGLLLGLWWVNEQGPPLAPGRDSFRRSG